MCTKDQGEDGFSLLELLLAVPLMIMLGFSMLQLFGLGIRTYADFLGDWELMQQVRIPMNEIASDVQYCTELKEYVRDNDNRELQIRRPLLWTNGDDYLVYRFTRNYDSDGGYWLRKNNQPVLGKTSLTNIKLEECRFKILDRNKVYVVLAGLNKDTGHRFKLERTLYSHGTDLPGVKREDLDDAG